MENLRKKKLFIFDMDNCLYKDVDNKLEEICFFKTFYDFVAEYYDISEEEVVRLDDAAMESHGHYLKGWLEMRPDFPLNKLFEKFKENYTLESVAFAETLPAWISKLNGHKVVYTNAHRWHAEQALAHMGILDSFDEIYSVDKKELNNDHYKPHVDGFKRILQDFGVRAEEAVMFEDSKTNLKTAHELGIATVLVNREKGEDDHHVHYDFETIDHFFEEFYKK